MDRPHPPFLWLILLLIPLYFLAAKWDKYEASQPRPKPTDYSVCTFTVGNVAQSMPCQYPIVTDTPNALPTSTAGAIPMPTGAFTIEACDSRGCHNR